MRDETGRNLNATQFLKLLVSQKPEIRVLLDVGAQMLELQNEELVRCWLKLRPDIEAAVYFNEEDELVALPQGGTPVPLYSSSFYQQLDRCIVYLDDGHTRGTDLKLPRNTRALVTLGPKVTKDRLLQGCMRMRKLGHGQSVLFAAPPETDRQIRTAASKPLAADESVDTLDVLRWAMIGTCMDLKRHVPHWAHQALEYKRRAEAEQKYSQNADVSHLKSAWMVPESRSLEEMYGIRSDTELSNHDVLTKKACKDPSLKKRLKTLGVEMLDDPSMDEEQEREVSHEIEREQQVERPSKVAPAEPKVHPGVRYLITYGKQTTAGIDTLFLQFGSFGKNAVNSWSAGLKASTDFSQTVKNSPPGRLSDYMRPVNWILEAPDDVFVVLSPYEVNELLPLIRESKVLRLHVYAPRVTKSMVSFSNLNFFSIPSQSNLPLSRTLNQSIHLVQLDIFAGQLYFSDYWDYRVLCSLLGLFSGLTEYDEQEALRVESDGFVRPEHRKRLFQFQTRYGSKFTKSPVPMLKELIGRRRKGMKYLLTHVGQILNAQILTPSDFQVWYVRVLASCVIL